MDSYNYFTNFKGQYIIYTLAILGGLWFLLRELRNWYWKHNQMISLMQEISDKLTKIDNSINMKNNNISKIEVTEPEVVLIKEKVEEIKTTDDKPKESIWAKKIF